MVFFRRVNHYLNPGKSGIVVQSKGFAINNLAREFSDEQSRLVLSSSVYIFPPSHFRVRSFVQKMIEGDTNTYKRPSWELYMDGVTSSQGTRARVLLIGLDKIKIEYILKISFKTADS